jgi:hypothetical protein
VRVIWETEIGDATLYAIEDGWSIRDPLAMFIDAEEEPWAARPEFVDA